MSVATLRGEGEGVFERYRYRFRQSQPFLRRNVYKSQQFLTMGSAISSLSGALAPVKSLQEPMAHSDEDEEDIRPAKRRKTSTFNPPTQAPRFPSESPRRKPFGHVTNESRRVQSRLAGKLQAVQPSAFYGKRSHATAAFEASSYFKRAVTKDDDAPTLGIDSILPQSPLEFERALQIEVIGIESKDVEDQETLDLLEGLQGPVDVECQCTVALFYENRDGSAVPQPESLERYRQLRHCTLRMTLDGHGGVKREVMFLRPFVLTSQEVFVDRKRPGPSGDLETFYEWADKYLIMVTLKSAGSRRYWPPVSIKPSADSSTVSDLVDEGTAQKGDIYLYCKVPKMLSPSYQDRATDLFLCWHESKQKLPFGLRVRCKWSLPSPFTSLPIRTSQIESPRQAQLIHTASVAPPSPLATRGEGVSAANSPANERAHRRRSNVPTTYNLKTLSAQAQGKSPRAPRGSRTKSDSSDSIINVTYCLGKADASEYGTRQQTTVSGMFCPFCCCDKSSLEGLRTHLQIEHTSFKFCLRGTQSKPRIFVELAKHTTRSDPALEKSRTFQMGKPQTLFNLEKYLNGDNSWARSREGPQHNHWPEHLVDRFHESSSSPYESRHSSPNTSNDTDGMCEYENQSKAPVRTRKVFYVPNTTKPLYNSITKQRLEVGAELPSSDDEKDEGWLHQKHRDIILDFSDVNEDEKDYMIKWNPFIMDIQLTSEKYLPEAVLQFAEENKHWFLQRRSRKVEFGKHMETFVMRGVMTQACFSKAVDILRQTEQMAARAETGDVDMDREEEITISPARQRGTLDCVCGGHTEPPDRVICRGLVSVILSSAIPY